MSNMIYASVGYGIRLTDEGPGGFNLGSESMILGKIFPEKNHGLRIEFHEVRGGTKYHEPMLLVDTDTVCKKHGQFCPACTVTSSGDAASDLSMFLAALALHKEEWDTQIGQGIAGLKEQGFSLAEEKPHPILYLHSDNMIK